MASRWLTSLSLLSATLLFASAGWHFWEMHRADERMPLQRIGTISRELAPSLADAIQHDDAARIHELLARLVSDPRIRNATLRTPDGDERDFGDLPSNASSAAAVDLDEIRQRGDHLRWFLPLPLFASTGPAQQWWLDLRLEPNASSTERWHFHGSWLLMLAAAILLLIATLAMVRRRSIESALPDSGDGGKPTGGAGPASDDLAYVSHELRAPLSGMLGFCRLLENTPLDRQQRAWLRHIQLASNGLLDTVDHVLGDDRRRQAENVFDIADLLWEINSLQAPLAQAKGIVLLGIVHDEVPPRLVGSPIAVRQLLTNLINNAIKYAGRGDVITHVVLDHRDGDRVRLRISVESSDNGDEKHRRRLRRALAGSTPVTDARKGTGLAICRRLTTDLNGSIGLEPHSADRNTVVARIELGAREPFVRPAESDLEQANSASATPHHARILVVDDDELSQHYLDALMPIVGARPLIAGSVEKALAVAASHEIDLVLMDLHLGEACGVEVSRRLRALGGGWSDKPIIAMTADAGAHARWTTYARTFHDLIVKPLDERRLRQLLSCYLPLASTHRMTVAVAPAVLGTRTAGLADANAATRPVVDRELALRLSGGREALADEMLARLIEELPGQRRQLARAWRRRDSAAFSEAVHKLGGACRYCGVPALSAACEALETRLRSDGLMACETEWQTLLTACDRLLSWADERKIVDAACHDRASDQ